MKETVYGFVNDELEIDTLENLCVSGGIQTGPFGSQLHQKDYLAIGTPIITVEHLGENRVLHQEIPRVSDADKERLARYVMRKGDIIFSRVGSVDRRSLVRDEEDGWLFSGRCIRVRANSTKIDSEYLSWFFGLEVFKDYIRRIAVGATMPSLNTELLSNVPILFPSLPEQRAIAEVLGALDDKIELNRRMNRTLESMARAVFHHEFVANEEANNWQIIRLGEALSVLETGSRPKGGVSQEPVGMPSVGAESIVKLGYFDFSKTKYVPIEFYETMRRGHVEDRDVLLYKDGGRPGEFEPHISMFGDDFPFKEFSINEHVYRIRAKDPLSQAYLYFWLESDEIMDEMRNRGTGVAIPGLNSTALSEILIYIPPREKIDDFSKIVEPLISKIFANAKESHTLASLRDTLLPKLMRGEVRVKDTEGIV